MILQPESPNSLYEQAAAWVIRINGEPSEIDLDKFALWQAQGPQYVRAYEDASRAWTAVGENSSAPKLLAMRREALERTGRYTRRWNRRGLAAGLVALIALPLAILYNSSTRPPEQAFETGRGEQRVIVLADGSRMSLDAMTRVKVVYGHDERRVTLTSGRANFEVARDLARPMNVHAGPRTVTALGTVFTVEREPHDVVVTLVEGRVAVTSGNRARALIEMKPLQQLRIDDDGAITMRDGLDPVLAMAWREGKLIFDNEPLVDVVATMNNYVTTPIVVEGSARELRVSGVFKAGDTPAFVEAMESLFPVEASRHPHSITLQMKN
ncbi:MAG TPA: FecR domain-containing protein [Steroidobacteraceae bacterium]|nr:FecR domain-containing protein [Steroidobacteraceae bacterium]